MALQIKTSVKHLLIDKANSTMFAVVAVSSLVVVFSLLSAKALLSQSNFQHKVLKAKNTVVSQLKDDISSADKLKSQYDIFESGNPNIIGGQGGSANLSNPGSSDGDNARIVLDALPSQYDFPALTSSLEKIVTNDNIGVQGIGGSDTSAQAVTGSSTGTSSQTSQSQTMPFTLSAQTSYNNGLTLIKDLERSIRPFDITSLSLQGNPNTMSISIQANTYYQPGVSLQIGSKALRQ